MADIKPAIIHYAYKLKEHPREDGTCYVQLIALCGKCFYDYPRLDGAYSLWDFVVSKGAKKYCPYCGSKHDWSDWIERITKEIKEEEDRGNEVSNKEHLWL